LSVYVSSYRSSVLFDKDGSGIHEVSLSPAASTNATELNLIFSKMLGVCDDLEYTSSKRQIKVLYNSDSNVVENDAFGFQSKNSSKNNYSCQGVNYYFNTLYEFSVINCRHLWLQYNNQE